MIKRHSNILPTAGVHVYKYNTANAGRLLSMMRDERTPPATRRALRDSIRRIAACTDADAGTCFQVETLAVLLTVALTLRLSFTPAERLTWERAHAASALLWRIFNGHDREVHPRRWAAFDRIMENAARRERRPRAARACRPSTLTSTAPRTLRAAA